MSNFEFVKTKKEESAFIITLDNPPVNALSLKMLGEISDAVRHGNEDSETRGLIITGSGNNAFCAGADLKMMQGLKPEDAVNVVVSGHNTFFAVEDSPKPVIAAVNGLALGGGNELAMSCDLRFVSDRARFGQPEVTLGLIPAWGGTQRMSRLIGKGKAKELIFSGQIINAQEALRIGLVNKIIPDGEELRAASDYIRMLASKVSPLAVAHAKIAINKGLQKASLNEALQYEVDAIQVLAQSEDLKEGVQAFFEKRPPKFTGK
ncbi:MAG: enoyl-CoA hydratase/isomerase family protein [Nitrososphaerales archaeon]